MGTGGSREGQTLRGKDEEEKLTPWEKSGLGNSRNSIYTCKFLVTVLINNYKFMIYVVSKLLL